MYLLINCYCLQGSRGGGLICWIKKELDYEIIATCSTEKLMEYIFYKIRLGSKSIVIGNVYIHPTANANAIRILNDQINKVGMIDVLSGDFNAHNKIWSMAKENLLGKLVSNLLAEHDLKPINKKSMPTHYNSQLSRAGSPDIFAISKELRNKLIKVKIGKDLSSDHFPILVTLEETCKSYTKNMRNHWIFKKSDKEKYNNLVKAKWKEIQCQMNRGNLQSSNIDEYYTVFRDVLIEAAKESCPRTNGKFRYRGNPWWNEECARAIKIKAKLRRLMMENGTIASRLFYKRQYNKTRMIIRKAKKDFWEKHNKENSLLDAYKIVRNFNNKRIVPRVTTKGLMRAKGVDTANAICEYFSKVGLKKDSIANYQEVKANVNGYKNLISTDLIRALDRKIENSEVKQIIKYLKPRKASGVDQVETFMLKFANDEIVEVITNLFNTILLAGKIPNIWKKGIIVPIPKTKDNKVEVDKFRPICLLSVVGKVFEKIIMIRLNKIINEINVIPKSQSGFVKGKSTLNNQIILQQKIHDTFMGNGVMVAVFLDIKKAYDCVDRKLLTKELKQLGLRGRVSECVYDILGEDRASKVIFDGVESSEMEFVRGVPQGSPLSPLLFNIYMKDINSICDTKNILQFADDIVIWEKGQCINEMIKILNQRIKSVSEWCRKRGLRFSPGKCVPVIFTRKRKINPPDIIIDGKKLDYKTCAKYLGLTWDKTLSWKEHIRNIVNKCTKKIGTLKFLCNRHSLRQEIAIALYKTLIRPTIEYGSEVWSDTTRTNFNKINSLEHKALTTALGSMIYAKRSETNMEAGVLPLEIRIKERIMKGYKRMQSSDLGEYVDKNRVKRNKLAYRKSFSTKVNCLQKYFNLKDKELRNIKKEEIDKITIKDWKHYTSLQRIPDKEYFNKNWERRYKGFSKSRTVQKYWHQARLKTLPTKDLLFKLNCKKDNSCIFDNEIETNKHFLTECKGYEQIWKSTFGDNNIRDKGLKVLLDEDRLPPFDRKISEVIIKSFKLKKKRSYE